MHDLGQDYTLSKLRSLLKNDMCLTDDAIAKICDCVKDSDLCSASRAQTFHKMFSFFRAFLEPK